MYRTVLTKLETLLALAGALTITDKTDQATLTDQTRCVEHVVTKQRGGLSEEISFCSPEP